MKAAGPAALPFPAPAQGRRQREVSAPHSTQRAPGLAHRTPRTGRCAMLRQQRATRQACQAPGTVQHTMHRAHPVPCHTDRVVGTMRHLDPSCSPTMSWVRSHSPFPLKGRTRVGQSQDRDRTVPCGGGVSLPHPHAALPSPRTPSPFPPIVRWRQGHGFLPVTSPAITLRFQGRWAPGNKASCQGTARTRQAAFSVCVAGGGQAEALRHRGTETRRHYRLENGSQLLLPGGLIGILATAARGEGSVPPVAAGLGNIRLSVGFVGAVLLPLLPPARSGRGAGNQNPPQPLQTKPQTTQSALGLGSPRQLEVLVGSWGDPAVPEGIWVSAGLAALPAAPGHSAVLMGLRSMGRWQHTRSEFSHLQ